jgi:uncharacterized peroxidase-related enzyme
MPLLAPLSNDQAPAESQKLFDGLQARFTTVPNIFRTMGQNPAILRATVEMDQAIHGDLPARLRELAYIKTSQINNCSYCLHYHMGLGRRSGLTDGQLENLDRYEDSGAFSDLERDVLRFAEQWTCQGQAGHEGAFRLARQLTPSQLVALAATVGLANWTNRFNTTFDVELP